MKPNACLTEQEMTLYHYEELGDSARVENHLGECAACRGRLAQLASDLERLPQPAIDVDPATATRMAARVSECLEKQRRPIWIPALGGTLAATAALVLTLVNWQPAQITPVQDSPVATVETFTLDPGDLPEVDFLEDLELLEELELLSQLEGV